MTTLIVGIDPGVKTGLATYLTGERRLSSVRTLGIVQAMDEVRRMHAAGMVAMLVFEDARLRRGGFGRADEAEERSGAGIREGIGSVKRDSSIWAEFAEHHGIPSQPIEPAKVATKLDADEFKAATGWSERTSQHGRDAAMVAAAYAGASFQRAAATAKAGTERPPEQVGPAPAPGACRNCGHQRGEHLPSLGNCPAGERVAGAFARFGTSKWAP